MRENNKFDRLNRSTKSGILTFLLCLLGGRFGLHRFYTGNYVLGIFMLLTYSLLPTVGGIGLWMWFDLARICSENYHDSENKRVAFRDDKNHWPKLALAVTSVYLLRLGWPLLTAGMLPAVVGAPLLILSAVCATKAAYRFFTENPTSSTTILSSYAAISKRTGSTGSGHSPASPAPQVTLNRRQSGGSNTPPPRPSVRSASFGGGSGSWPNASKLGEVSFKKG